MVRKYWYYPVSRNACLACMTGVTCILQLITSGYPGFLSYRK